MTEETSGHQHKITSICEFNENKNHEIVLKEIFAYKMKENDTAGVFSLSNYVPRAYEKIKACGIDTLDNIFKK